LLVEYEVLVGHRDEIETPVVHPLGKVVPAWEILLSSHDSSVNLPHTKESSICELKLDCGAPECDSSPMIINRTSSHSTSSRAGLRRMNDVARLIKVPIHIQFI
jgi:hypothetical protein